MFTFVPALSHICRRILFLLFLSLLPLGAFGSSDALLNVSRGWDYLYVPAGSDPAKTLARISESPALWKEMGDLRQPRDWNGSDELWLRLRLPEFEAFREKNPILYIGHVDQSFEIYRGGTPVFRVGEFRGDGSVAFPGWSPFRIPLAGVGSGETLLFRVGSRHDNIGLTGDLLVGPADAVVEHIFSSNLDSVVTGSILVALGLFVCLLFLWSRRDPSQLAYAGFVVFQGLYLLSGIPASVLVFKAPLLRVWLELVTMYLSSACLVMYFEGVFRAYDKRRIIRMLSWMYVAFVSFAVAGAGMGLFPLLKTMRVWHFLLIPTCPTLLWFLVRGVLRKNPEAVFVGAGFLVYFVAIVVATLSALAFLAPHWRFFSMVVGLWSVVIGLGLVIVHRYREMKRQLEGYAREMEEKNAQLQELDHLKDQFLANTSHELRTPLVGILGLAESLAEGAAGPVSQRMRRNLSLIVQSGRRLSTLINDILDFSKLKDHRVELRREPTDVGRVVELVVAMSVPLLGKKEVSLVNAVPDSLVAADADPNRLQQILYNLVGNAIKFTESGSVMVSAREIGNEIELSVADTGIGIASELREKIFVPFEQGDASTTRKFGGTGLGLSVTRTLVEMHGGRISFDSEPGRGTTFRFTLPRSWEAPRDDETGETRESPIDDIALAGDEESASAEASPREGQGRILVVDDEPVNRQVLENVLAPCGFEVLQAESGDDALALLQDRDDVDLVLLDIMMPGKSGYAVCQEVRRRWGRDELPIIFLTAKNQLSNLVEGFTMGGNDYLTKPFFKNELLARLRVQLELSRATRALRSANSRMDELLAATHDMTRRAERQDVIRRAVDVLASKAGTGALLRVAVETCVRGVTGELFLKSSECELHIGDGGNVKWKVVRESTSRPKSLPVPPQGTESLLEMAELGFTLTAFHEGDMKARVHFAGMNPALLDESMVRFFQVVGESMAIVLGSRDAIEARDAERKSRDEEEKRSLRRVVGIAARVSDKLNSPLLVLTNCFDALPRLWATLLDAQSGVKGDVSAAHLAFQERSEKITSAIQQIVSLSRELSEIRDEGEHVEATAAMREAQ